MKYPSGIKKKSNSVINYGKRGMNLENEINDTNNYYLVHKIAIIHKKPVPITVTKFNYKTGSIDRAFFNTPSTTDYNGIYKGRYLDFEAKETKHKSYFPLGNIHSHQIKHLENIYNHGGIAFLIIRFSTYDETYYLKAEDFISFLNETNRKSIPLTYIKEKGFLIKTSFSPRLNYLKIIDTLYFKEN